MEKNWIFRTLLIVLALWGAKTLLVKILGTSDFAITTVTKSDLENSRLHITPSEMRLGRGGRANIGGTSHPKVKSKSPDVDMKAVEQKTGPAVKAAVAAVPATPATKADNAKKKKKKKKKTPQAKITHLNPPLAAQPAPTPSEAAPQESNSFNGAGGVATANNTPPAGNQVAANPKSVEDWARVLLNPPTYENVVKMIDYYHSGTIDQPTFYGLVDRLLQGNTTTYRSYAIVALASSTNQDSFERLAALSGTEQDPTNAAHINEALKYYAKVKYLSMLSQEITNPDPYVRYQALEAIRTSAIKYVAAMGPLGSSTATENGNGTTANPRPARNFASLRLSDYYSPLIAMLQASRAKETDKNLITQFNNSIAAVQDLLAHQPVALN